MPAAPGPAPDRWRRIEDLFEQASLCPPQSRAAFLEHACGTDYELRHEVESLLSGLDASSPFLESAVEEAAQSYLGDRADRPVAEGTILDHYKIVHMLGSGGMGVVYLATDTRLDRKVALKVLPSHLTRDPAALGRLKAEARLLSALNHANLLTIFEFGQFEGRHFLVTEYIEGSTLRQILDSGRPDRSKAVDIALQVAAALRAAHASGVIHRDIKPENIIVRPDGWVKVLDFGIARLAEHPSQPGLDATAAGAVLGTPRYMSPEQARGVPLDVRSDLFSLGAVFYEMLTGVSAFRGDTRSDVIADILRGRPQPVTQLVPDTPKPLQAIVEKALAKDPDSRYQNAESMHRHLDEFRRESEFHSHPRASQRWRRGLMWAAVLVLLAVSGIGLWWKLPRRTSGPATSVAPRTLAVLPFRNLKPGADTDFLGFSLADEVVGKLGYVKALTVRPSAATNHYRDANPDLPKTADALNADMLLTGTYLKDGGELRITARLVGFHPESILWQNTIDVPYDKLLSVQDRVAKMIIDGLSIRLGADERVRLAGNQRVDSLAYEYYLRGVDLYSGSNFAGAIAVLEKSAAIDPGYAPTWAYLGRAYTTNGSLEFGGRDHYRRAEAAYSKAIELDPVFPEPRIYMANLFTDTGRVEEAVPLLRVALKSSPNNAEAHWELGYAYRYAGMLDASVAECELARRLDPEVKINSSALNTYLYRLEYDKFLASLPSNDSPLLIFYHGLGSYYKGDMKQADTDFDRAFELAPDLLPAQIGMALRDGLRHEAARGLARLRETERRMNENGVIDPEGMYKVAQAYAVLGDRDAALRMLRQTITGGFFCYDYIAADPLLSSLRDLPEFRRFLDQTKQRHLQFEERFSRPAAN